MLTNKVTLFISVLVNMDLSLSDHTSLLLLWESQEGSGLHLLQMASGIISQELNFCLGKCHFPALASQMPESGGLLWP